MVEDKMKSINIDKIVVHICAGEIGTKLDNSKKVLSLLTDGRKPAETKSKTKLPKWGLRPGLAIGAKITLRKKSAEDFLKKTLKAKRNTLTKRCFDKNGGFAFGIKEYIDVEGMKYDPKVGVFGFDVLVNLKKPGSRVKDRVLKSAKLGENGRITREEAQDFVTKAYGVVLE